MSKHYATYQWSHHRPGWTWAPCQIKLAGNFSNILWKRSRIRVALGWLLYFAGILGLSWLVVQCV